MDRKIEFRAWDKEAKAFCEDLFGAIYWEDLSLLDYILMDAENPELLK